MRLLARYFDKSCLFSSDTFLNPFLWLCLTTSISIFQAQTAVPKLWFVNLGAYSASDMAEQHQFGLITAESTQAAKAKTKRMWLRGLDQIHKDDLFPVDGSPNVDDLLPIDGNGLWHVRLTPSSNETNDSDTPEWYGYWRI